VQRFVDKHQNRITGTISYFDIPGTISCFDRVLFKGHLPLG